MTVSQEKKGVLIVDDARFTRMTLKRIIEKSDIAQVVGEANDGNSALKMYKQLKPDLVTMDLVMPNVNGITAIEEIIKFDKKAVIVVVSAMGQEELIFEATQKGAKDFIQKPIKEEQMLIVLNKHLK